jgi:hypothetical protein
MSHNRPSILTPNPKPGLMPFTSLRPQPTPAPAPPKK